MEKVKIFFVNVEILHESKKGGNPMRVDSQMLKEALLNNTPVEQRVNMPGNMTMGNNQTVKSSPYIRPSHGFPRTNVEKNYKEAIASFEEISSAAQTQLLSMTHQNLDYIANTVTPTDAYHAKGLGFTPENTSVEGYVTVVDKIKIHMAMGNDDFKNYGEALSASQIAKVTGGAMAKKIATKMASLDVPVTDDNINAALKAVAEGEKIVPLNDGDKKYLIENDVLPTIENLYKAEHASLSAQNNLSDEIWSEVSTQAEQIIEEAGLEINEETVAMAKWLIANELPVTPENLYAKKFYDELSLPITSDKLIPAVAVAMNRGEKPIKAFILGDNLNSEYIKCKKELLEARAILTVEAKKSMEQNGMEVNLEEITKELEKIEELEREYYSKLLDTEGIPVSEEKIDTILDTLSFADSVKEAPEYILGGKPFDMTLPQLAKEGDNLKQNLNRINEKYETVMTRPRADMGDSINKAFRNIPDILEDLGLEVNRDNAKAVRILAYNQIPINEENISLMRNTNMEIQNTLDLIKPETVVHMIKNDINPLELTMEKLGEVVQTINEENDFEGCESYSEFLWKAQKSDLTESERAEYIEIYRMLRTIEKSDGAVVGALVNQGADLTIKNLVTSAKSRKKYSTEYSISENEASVAKYHNLMATRAVKEISPTEMKAADLKKPIMDQTLPEFLENAATALEEEPHLQDEKIMQEIQYEESRLTRFSTAATTEEEVLRLLSDNNIPMELFNILASRDIQGRRSTRYERLFKASDATSMEEIKGEILQKLGEAVKSPKEMAEAMETLGDVAENVMKGMINDENASILNIQNAKMMYAQMNLTMELSKREHYDIPVLIGDEVTGVSLKIVRGEKDKGKVDIVFDLGEKNGGKVAAEFVIRESINIGTIAAENEGTLKLLEENKELLLKGMNSLEDNPVELHFANIPGLNIDKFLQTDSEEKENTNEEHQVQTKRLFGAAKEFMSYVKSVIDR